MCACEAVAEREEQRRVVEHDLRVVVKVSVSEKFVHKIKTRHKHCTRLPYVLSISTIRL